MRGAYVALSIRVHGLGQWLGVIRYTNPAYSWSNSNFAYHFPPDCLRYSVLDPPDVRSQICTRTGRIYRIIKEWQTERRLSVIEQGKMVQVKWQLLRTVLDATELLTACVVAGNTWRACHDEIPSWLFDCARRCDQRCIHRYAMARSFTHIHAYNSPIIQRVTCRYLANAPGVWCNPAVHGIRYAHVRYLGSLSEQRRVCRVD